MTTLAHRIKEAMDEKPCTVSELARACGIKPPSVSDWLNGKTQSLKAGTAYKAAVFLGVNQLWLTEGRGRKIASQKNTGPGPDVRQFAPLISWVRAGKWSEAVDVHEPGYADDWLPCPKNGRHTYALRVRGDSMTAPYGKTYPDGCVIFVDPDRRSPSNGDRIIAKLKGSDEVTFKAFQQDAGRTWLKPLNPQHPAIMEPFTVLGTVIGKWEDE